MKQKKNKRNNQYQIKFLQKKSAEKFFGRKKK